MTPEPDHFLLRRYAVARERGDREEAEQIWEQLIVNNFDRVKQIVRAFSFSPGGPKLPEHEWGSAASQAYFRVSSMGASFRGLEPAQFYAALKTCVENTCLDYGRKELRHEKRSAGSFDKKFEPGGEAGPFDPVLADYYEDQRRRTADAIEAEISRVEAEEMVAWAIGQIENDNYREVLELTWFQKLSGEEIADQLGISKDNVYARRMRGLKELERIVREHGS